MLRRYSPARISSLWEPDLLNANFIDLRVIYDGRGLIDMKNLDGASTPTHQGCQSFRCGPVDKRRLSCKAFTLIFSVLSSVVFVPGHQKHLGLGFHLLGRIRSLQLF
jgi:hypothetical protein